MIESIQRRNERTESIGFRKAKELLQRTLRENFFFFYRKISIEDIKGLLKLAKSNEKEFL